MLGIPSSLSSIQQQGMGLEWVNNYFALKKIINFFTSKQNSIYKMKTSPDANILVY